VSRRLPAIGITCYPTQGGSGIVATELGLNLARSGYEVHFISSSLPLRLRKFRGNVIYHQVDVVNYPVFLHPPYTLSLASAMSEVAVRHNLDILHVHYAIPHAASAYLAQQMVGPDRLKVVTTLHGTDITLVGQEPSFFPITKFLIERSNGVTAVSEFLAKETRDVFGVTRPVEVIPNFVDTRRFKPSHDPAARAAYAPAGEPLLVHASNYRRVKNVGVIADIFARVNAVLPSRLLLIGDGPDLAPLLDDLAARGLCDRVRSLGTVNDLERLLPLADLLLLPSLHESFGLVALEAMACGVPAIATNQGGTSEFIDDGINGFLRDPHDTEGMAADALRVLGDPGLLRHLGEEARRDAVETYGARCVLKRYIDHYDRVLAG
jgi:N-acetyl-alpha-D-glucosaminyl L-malate synthase BshA